MHIEKIPKASFSLNKVPYYIEQGQGISVDRI